MTQGNLLSSNSTATVTTTFIPNISSTKVQGSDQQPVNKEGKPSLTDTMAAVTIAVLAVVLVIILMLIVRTVRRRRREQQGQELNHIPTVTSGIVSANVNAYRGHNPSRQHSGVISWEPVISTPSTSTTTTSADILATSEVSGVPSSC